MDEKASARGLRGLFAFAAQAQTAEFYIVQDSSTKILDKKPTVTTTTVVGDGVLDCSARRTGSRPPTKEAVNCAFTSPGKRTWLALLPNQQGRSTEARG